MNMKSRKGNVYVNCLIVAVILAVLFVVVMLQVVVKKDIQDSKAVTVDFINGRKAQQ